MVDRLDFAAMVQTSAEGKLHLRFLVEILLASAIQCEDKEKYIRTIMSDLDHDAQVLLTRLCAYMCVSRYNPHETPLPPPTKNGTTHTAKITHQATHKRGQSSRHTSMDAPHSNTDTPAPRISINTAHPRTHRRAHSRTHCYAYVGCHHEHRQKRGLGRHSVSGHHPHEFGAQDFLILRHGYEG